MSKRKLHDLSDDVGALTVKPEAAAEMIVKQAKKWTDTCGSLFSVEHKLVKERDYALLKIGFFDEIDCKTISTLRDVQLPGGFEVSTFNCDLSKSAIHVKIVRLHASAQKKGRLDSTNGDTRLKAHGNTDEIMRYRIMFDIKENDCATVHAVIEDIKAEFDTANECTVSGIANRPKHYLVIISMKTNTIPEGAIVKASECEGAINFEKRQLTVLVEKQVSDLE
jgi:hypothetical protein